MRKDGRTGRDTHTTKLTVAFYNFTNAPKNGKKIPDPGKSPTGYIKVMEQKLQRVSLITVLSTTTDMVRPVRRGLFMCYSSTLSVVTKGRSCVNFHQITSTVLTDHMHKMAATQTNILQYHIM